LDLSAANYQPNVTIRIKGIKLSGIQNFNAFGIDNLILFSDNTRMEVRSASNSPVFQLIAHQAVASATNDTDFGSLLTNEESSVKTYRISNTGSKPLIINSIAVIPSDQGFA